VIVLSTTVVCADLPEAVIFRAANFLALYNHSCVLYRWHTFCLVHCLQKVPRRNCESNFCATAYAAMAAVASDQEVPHVSYLLSFR